GRGPQQRRHEDLEERLPVDDDAHWPPSPSSMLPAFFLAFFFLPFSLAFLPFAFASALASAFAFARAFASALACSMRCCRRVGGGFSGVSTTWPDSATSLIALSAVTALRRERR